MFQQLINWLTTWYEQTMRVVKAVSLISALVGAYYFAAYLRALGVPFPVDFSVLPSVLLAIGVVAVGITAIIFVYILLAGWIQMDPLNMGYAELIHLRPSGLVGHGGRIALENIAVIYVIPYLAWLVALYQIPENCPVIFYLLGIMLVFFVWAYLFALAKTRDTREHDRHKRNNLIMKISVSVFSVSFFTMISSLVYILLLTPRGLIKTWYQVLLSLVVFAAININVLYPMLNINAFNKANKEAFDRKMLNGPSLAKRIYKAPVLLTVGGLILITLFPPFSGYVGELTTKLLGLSSNESRVIYTDTKIGKAWPPSLRASCGAHSCQSVPVIVALDLGKYLYVRPKDGGSIYRLERTYTVEQFMERKEK